MAKAPEAASARLYENIARELKQGIDLGHHPAGSRLPSERELSDKFGVSRPVVREAIIVLELRGLVQRRQGAGVYVNAKAPAARNSGEDADGPFEVTEARRLLEARSRRWRRSPRATSSSPRWRRSSPASAT